MSLNQVGGLCLSVPLISPSCTSCECWIDLFLDSPCSIYEVNLLPSSVAVMVNYSIHFCYNSIELVALVVHSMASSSG